MKEKNKEEEEEADDMELYIAECQDHRLLQHPVPLPGSLVTLALKKCIAIFGWKVLEVYGISDPSLPLFFPFTGAHSFRIFRLI